jgi:hypothetical protein
MRTIRWIGLSAGIAGALLGCSSSSAPAGSADAGGNGTQDGAKSSSNDSGKTKGDSGASSHDGSTGDATHPKDSSVAKDGESTGKDGQVSTGSEGGVDAVADVTGILDAGKDAPPPGPVQMLVTFGGATSSETVVISMATKAVEGRIPFLGAGITDTRNTTAPFLLEQSADVVAKLNATKPWLIDADWNVSEYTDGGTYNANPTQVVVQSSTQAYVISYERNQLAVVDVSSAGDAGMPGSTIDLAGYLQAGDSDGVVEMMGAAYVASSHRLYVVLANVDQALEAEYGGVICGSEVSTVVAIDTQTNTLVNLGGTGPKGSLVLSYYDPAFVVYDSIGGRLLIASTGCFTKPASVGGALGSANMRGVEAVNLATGKSTTLLPLTPTTFPAGFDDVPTGFAYIDSTHAVLGFDQTGQAVYAWDPTKSTIGANIPNAPDFFAYDGDGHLVGTRQDTADGGVMSTDIVSVTIPAGVSTTITKNVTSLTGAVFVSSVDVWPHP